MSLHISSSEVSRIRAEGEKSYPHECCGFLLGRHVNGVREIVRVEPALNAREDEARHNRYLITPDLFMRTERDARAHGLDILGFYHSHPDAPAKPSVFDTDHAWPWYVYIIVSILDTRAETMTAWQLRDDRSSFDELTIRITEQEA